MTDEITNPPPGSEDRRPGGWWTSLLLGCGLGVVYLANGRDPGTYDTAATTMLPLTLARGEGVYLDRFAPMLVNPITGKIPTYVTWSSNRRLLSRYPVAPALVVLPLIAPHIYLLDRLSPGWDQRGARLAFNECKLMARRALAVLMALAAVLLHRLLIGMGLGRVSVPAVLACALGSDLWVVGSQALWQHGPAAFCLVSAMSLLGTGPPFSRFRLLAGGLAAGLLVACRLMDVFLALGLLAFVTQSQPRRLPWFLPGPILAAGLLLGYNLHFFGDPIGGQAQLEQLHRTTHGVEGAWSGDLIDGAAGTLFSPNRGVFVFSPWSLLAVLALPFTSTRVARHSMIVWLLAATALFFLTISKYAVWWGGHCFGPRYWTDIMPIFAILLAFGLDWARSRALALLPIFVLTIVFSIAIQAIGALCFPSSWNLKPTNVDLNHQRLWDWKDNEVYRCLREYPGYHPHW